jgi:NAD(P)H dehydrogenase (quinone)
MTAILVLFDSVSEHTWRLAEAVAEGAAGLDGCQAALKQVPELADAERIFGPGFEEGRKVFADVETATIDDLVACDGLAIGTPVHYGNASSAMRFFLDQTVKQYLEGSFIGKPATVFVSSAVGVGVEAAIQSVWSILAVHGMTIVPVGMRAPEIGDLSGAHGGGPFGAATFTRAPGERPSDIELAIARVQGRALAEVSRAWAGRPS